MADHPLSYRAFNLETEQWVEALAFSPQDALVMLAPLVGRPLTLTLSSLQVMENGGWVWVV